jgi:hypothetical protein
MNLDFMKKNPQIVSIVLFLMVFTMIQMAQPSFLYKRDGSIRVFGIGYRNKTIFPIWLMAIILGVLCYMFVKYYLVTIRLFS